MTTRRRATVATRTTTKSKVVVRRQTATRTTVAPFVQLITSTYESNSGGTGTSLYALDADGVVWRYYHTEKAWIQVPSDRIAAV